MMTFSEDFCMDVLGGIFSFLVVQEFKKNIKRIGRNRNILFIGVKIENDRVVN